MPTTTSLITELKKLANPTKAQLLQGFFKTGPGQYGEGDIFWGITVPNQRLLAKKFIELKLKDLQSILNSQVHEQRLTVLLILTYQYERANELEKTQIFEFYLKHRQFINNWDLVDVTTPKIVGDYILKNPTQRAKVFAMINRPNLWERRIALLATFPFIRVGKFNEVKQLAAQVLTDKHDLIHKASGWMLREMGKKSEPDLITFLDQYYKQMPRTMLRYAIEKLAEPTRRKYLAK